MSSPLARPRRFQSAFVMVLALLLLSASALAQEAKVHASLATSADIWVGQRVTLVVELLAPGYFSGAPAFDLPDPRGLLIVPPGESPTISTEEMEGTSYTVQRHEFAVFARTAGVQTIPPLMARFHFKRSPLDADIQSAIVKTDAVSFTAQLPPGAEKLGTIISALNLQVVEAWMPEPNKAKAGDAFTRTITFTAPDVPAMLFPPFPAGQIDGLGIYPNPPEVRDRSQRGEMTGRRRDTITYVCKRPGEYRIPAVRMTWWDLDARQLRIIELPERTLEVDANPALDASPGAAAGGRKWLPENKWLVAWAVVLVALAGLFPGLRSIGRRVVSVFRPVHLAPLNPIGRPETEVAVKARSRTADGSRLLIAFTLAWLPLPEMALASDSPAPSGYAGSLSCRECHGRFYELWSTSHHGLAMQPYTREFADKSLNPQEKSITVNNVDYHFDLNGGIVIESCGMERNEYPVEHVMGGKYVYFFLTPMERGRLQVLPVSYDVRSKTWYDTTASFVRHFVGMTDSPVDWKDPLLTFNTACHACHVSQSSTSYDLKTDSYKSTWAEPGINCEACHGPGDEHNRIAKATPPGEPLKDPRIISAKTMTPRQRDDLCATCHTKAGPITAAFVPGDRYFDHFDLSTLEQPDFYPDGRDLGENYTYTLYRMSPCVKAGKLECMHCHTSSGRYRFKKEKFNNACMPCHEKYVRDPPVHTHHKPEGDGSKCISCHMPKTEFARMDRSDHSMRPPMPTASITFKSPNACNSCHADKDAQWADKFVREWRARDFQAPVIQVGRLIEAGRKRDWSRLEAMLAYIGNEERDEVFAASLIRLLMACEDKKKWPVLVGALDDPSPLVRAAGAEGLQGYYGKESVGALLKGTRDEYRLVRIKAASSLAVIPTEYLPEKPRIDFKTALMELQSSLTVRPDDFASHYNLGNHYMRLGQYKKAAESYETAIKLRPDAAALHVNASMAHVNLGATERAGESLRKALEIEPDNAAANFNLGLLLAESGRMPEAEKALRTALGADPQMAQAAYNLCVILAKDRIDEAVSFCGRACDLRPDDPKYAYTLAFYLYEKGDRGEAEQRLKAITERHPEYSDAQMLLKKISGKER